jgi:hypothetical protein
VPGNVGSQKVGVDWATDSVARETSGLAFQMTAEGGRECAEGSFTSVLRAWKQEDHKRAHG